MESLNEDTCTMTENKKRFKPETKDELKKAVECYFSEYNSDKKTYGPIEMWDTSLITDMSYLFEYLGNKCEGLKTLNLNNWDVSNVTNMECMFHTLTKSENYKDDEGFIDFFLEEYDGCGEYDYIDPDDIYLEYDDIISEIYNEYDPKIIKFEEYLETIDDELEEEYYTKKVKIENERDKKINIIQRKIDYKIEIIEEENETNADEANIEMLHLARREWNHMKLTWYSFNGILENWDVSSVTNMNQMFSGCEKFNQPLNKWDVSSVISMKEMFKGCTSLNKTSVFNK